VDVRLLLAAASVTALVASPSSASNSRVIPWIPERPRAAAEPRLAAPCEARTLRASLFLQGATGSLVGGAVVRNVGRTPCSLLGRPRARLVGTRALETAWRVVPARSPSPDLSAIYDPPSSLRALAPGRAAWVPLRWSNWCPPGTSETSTGPPPDALVLVLPQRRGNLRLVSAKPRAATPRTRPPRSPSHHSRGADGTCRRARGFGCVRRSSAFPLARRSSPRQCFALAGAECSATRSC
jgi:hypothetical protein